ncbi:DUF262 domain-containing protein [Methylomonas methanica]|nr:DUF262 domain-containing protein [Methylomonas methanica]
MKNKIPRYIPNPDEIDAAESQILEQSKRIDFYLTEYSVEMLASKTREQEFVVPEYQREFTWEPERKSKFIESLLMGLPIPFLFFWERPDGKLEIVDGSQRLRTIEEFVLGDFQLTELESLTLISGFKFSDLPESRQRKIRNRSIRGIILNEHADDQARFDLFERINTGSKKANKAEIRRGALNGPFMDFIIELATYSDFIDMTPMSRAKIDEREREELVTRFFAYSDGLNHYKDRPSQFLFFYVECMNKAFSDLPELADEYKERFIKTMSFVKRNFPLGFRRTRSKSANATPRSRFEAIAIGSWLALQESPEIAEKSFNVEDWHLSNEFINVIGADGANAKARLIGRINFVKDKLLEAE